MPAQSTKSVKPPPYPYEIPPIEYLKARNPKKLIPWMVQEFIRIEALLRSPKVMKLYTQTFGNTKKGDQTTDTLYRHYRVIQGWKVLKGHHHQLLCEKGPPSKGEKDQPYSNMGITDLKTKLRLSEEEGDVFWWELQEEILSGDHTNVVLEIDISHPIPDIIRALRKMIAEQKTQVKKIPDVWGHFINIINLDKNTWIDYFHCYDLRQCEGKTFGQIAGKVYGDATKKYENAETAYKRVNKLIHYAQTHAWPPPSNFLNKQYPPFNHPTQPIPSPVPTIY